MYGKKKYVEVKLRRGSVAHGQIFYCVSQYKKPKSGWVASWLSFMQYGLISLYCITIT